MPDFATSREFLVCRGISIFFPNAKKFITIGVKQINDLDPAKCTPEALRGVSSQLARLHSAKQLVSQFILPEMQEKMSRGTKSMPSVHQFYAPQLT